MELVDERDVTHSAVFTLPTLPPTPPSPPTLSNDSLPLCPATYVQRRLLCGSFPGAASEPQHTASISALLDAGLLSSRSCASGKSVHRLGHLTFPPWPIFPPPYTAAAPSRLRETEPQKAQAPFQQGYEHGNTGSREGDEKQARVAPVHPPSPSFPHMHPSLRTGVEVFVNLTTPSELRDNAWRVRPYYEHALRLLTDDREAHARAVQRCAEHAARVRALREQQAAARARSKFVPAAGAPVVPADRGRDVASVVARGQGPVRVQEGREGRVERGYAGKEPVRNREGE